MAGGVCGEAGEGDSHDLMAGRACGEGLGGVRENDDIAGAGTAWEDGANGASDRVKDGDGVTAAIGDNEGFAVWGDTESSGLETDGDDAHFAASFEVDDRDIVGGGVGNVGEAACGVKRDGNWLATHRDRRNNGVVLSIEDGDGAGRAGLALVDDVDLIACGVGCDGDGMDADGELAIETEVDDVVDGDGAAVSIGDVDVLAVVGRVLREVVGAAGGEGEQRDKRKLTPCLPSEEGGSKSKLECASDRSVHDGDQEARVSTWMPRGNERCTTGAICSISSIMVANWAG